MLGLLRIAVLMQLVHKHRTQDSIFSAGHFERRRTHQSCHSRRGDPAGTPRPSLSGRTLSLSEP